MLPPLLPPAGENDIVQLIKKNDIRTLKAALTHGLPKHARYSHGKSLLHMAAGFGTADMMKYLLEAIDLVDFNDGKGDTPLDDIIDDKGKTVY